LLMFVSPSSLFFGLVWIWDRKPHGSRAFIKRSGIDAFL